MRVFATLITLEFGLVALLEVVHEIADQLNRFVWLRVVPKITFSNDLLCRYVDEIYKI